MDIRLACDVAEHLSWANRVKPYREYLPPTLKNNDGLDLY